MTTMDFINPLLSQLTVTIHYDNIKDLPDVQILKQLLSPASLKIVTYFSTVSFCTFDSFVINLYVEYLYII